MLVCRRVRKPEEESQEETAKEEKEPALFLPQARLFRILLAFQQIQHWLEVRSACRLDRSGHLIQTVWDNITLFRSFQLFDLTRPDCPSEALNLASCVSFRNYSEIRTQSGMLR